MAILMPNKGQCLVKVRLGWFRLSGPVVMFLRNINLVCVLLGNHLIVEYMNLLLLKSGNIIPM